MSFGLFNFITFLFWVSSFMFLFRNNNLLTIILYSELVWVLLYSFSVISGVIVDDCILISTSFFLLALAGLEFCIGFIITIFFRSLKKSLELEHFNFNPNKQSNLDNFVENNQQTWKFIK